MFLVNLRMLGCLLLVEWGLVFGWEKCFGLVGGLFVVVIFVIVVGWVMFFVVLVVCVVVMVLVGLLEVSDVYKVIDWLVVVLLVVMILVG